MADDNLSIKVSIGNRIYPLTILRTEEENVRKAAKLVNENIKELEQKYAVKDIQDLLAMAALFYANKVVLKANTGHDFSSDHLNDLHDKIADHLNNL